MPQYLEHESVSCRNAEELQQALDGDKLAIKSVFCDRIKDTELLARVSEFPNLEYCGLSLCDANVFAERVGELKKLNSLDIQASQLTEFPTAATGLTQLKTLSLGNNGIETIPDEISSLQSVSEIYLMQNHLKQVPDALFELPLTSLSLNYNQLSAIPESISNLKEIETLILDCNQLTQLPKAIGSLKTLVSLSLSYNSLDSLPEEILQLNQLKHLTLENNNFTSLPEGFETFSNLIEEFRIDGKHRPLFMDWTYKHSDKPVQFELADMDLYMDKSDPGFAEIASKLDDVGAGEVKSQIRKSIGIKSTTPDDGSQKGISRLGGFPDLADESQLPRSDNGIWIFLFQVNLADIAQLNSYLPKSGLLSFFIRSLEEFECKVIFFEGDVGQLNTVRFDPQDLTDDQDDYTATPFHVEFTAGTSLPYISLDDPDQHTRFEKIFDAVNTVGDHSFNGHTFTQHESPMVQAADKLGGTPEEWIPLLKLGYDHQVGFCFWDAGTLTFTIHQEDLRRHDFSRVQVSLETS